MQRGRCGISPAAGANTGQLETIPEGDEEDEQTDEETSLAILHQYFTTSPNGSYDPSLLDAARAINHHCNDRQDTVEQVLHQSPSDSDVARLERVVYVDTAYHTLEHDIHEYQHYVSWITYIVVHDFRQNRKP